MRYVDTPLRLFVELNADGHQTGNYQMEYQRRVIDDAGVDIMRAEVRVMDITSEQGAVMLQSGAAALAADRKKLSSDMATIQGTNAALIERPENAEKIVAGITALLSGGTVL
jgi:hypothetical protein